MSAFGPFYPRRLQLAVNHAERLAAFLAREERRASPSPLWLIGRAGEVARFVETVASEYRSEGHAEACAACLGGYLQFVHEGIAIHLGREDPACCAEHEATVVPPDPGRTTEDTVERLLRNLEESPRRPRV